jgi:hypothetical protein
MITGKVLERGAGKIFFQEVFTAKIQKTIFPKGKLAKRQRRRGRG